MMKRTVCYILSFVIVSTQSNLLSSSSNFPDSKAIRVDIADHRDSVLPTARSSTNIWKYTFEEPGEDWLLADFDDSGWKTGKAGFGTPDTPRTIVGTIWDKSDIWLRRNFTIEKLVRDDLAWLIHYDENAEVYLNGVAAGRFPRWSRDYGLYKMAVQATNALKTGSNVIAVHASQSYGGQYIDVGIVHYNPSSILEAGFIEPLFDYPVRDTCICLGHDGLYYLTGTTGHPTWWNTNEGIRVWRSKDLINWQPLGLVWSIEKDGTWQKPTKGGKRAIWAPEIHYLKGTYWLTYCLNWPGGGTGLLRSTSSRAEGPYVDVKADGPMTKEIDASLFQDDNGEVYFVLQDGKIARLKDDMSGLAERPEKLKPANAEHVGFEGAFLFKAHGRYYLSCAEFNGQYYDCMIASSDNLKGPYGDRYLAIPHAGHNMFFRDKNGQYYSTFFGNDPAAPFRERSAILKIRFDNNGKILPVWQNRPIDWPTLEQWSSPYRNWYYWQDHVISAKPAIEGYEEFHNTDVPTVYRLPGDDKWYMSFIGFDGRGYNSFVAESCDLIHWEKRRLAMGFGPKDQFDHGGRVLGAYLYQSYGIKVPRILKKLNGKFWSLFGAYPLQGGYELRPGYEGVAASIDGLRWKRAQDKYILSVHEPDCGNWEKDCIYQPWLVEHNGEYYNFYNAANGSIEQIGLATSVNLFQWKRYRGNPVIRNTPGGYDEKFCSDGKVFWDGDHWTTFYFGVGRGGAHIMVAFSWDLFNWVTHPEPLYKAGGHPLGLDKTYAHKISLVYNRENDTYYMYYCAVGNKGRGIGLITSKPIAGSCLKK